MSEVEPKQAVYEVRLLFKVEDLAVLTALITLAKALNVEVENITRKDKEQ